MIFKIYLNRGLKAATLMVLEVRTVLPVTPLQRLSGLRERFFGW